MKKAIVFIMLLICSCANAGEMVFSSSDHPEPVRVEVTPGETLTPEARKKLSDKQTRCMRLGAIFQAIASGRESHIPPKTEFSIIKKGMNPQGVHITDAQIKNAINLVYFDPAFAYAGGVALAKQVVDSCMNDFKPEFEPLK